MLFFYWEGVFLEKLVLFFVRELVFGEISVCFSN